MSAINQFFFKTLFNRKSSKAASSNKGFTLVELLVSTIVAFLIITPLLAFVVNILDTERKEEVKAATDQEIQAAIDYIGRDLAQAVYIYDGDGLKLTGIEKQLPYLNNRRNRAPILVFWKRNYVRQVIPINQNQTNPATFCRNNREKCNDGYRYSLVGYYVVRDNNNVWSQAARIVRFELKDAVRYFNGQAIDTNDKDTKGDDYFAPFSLDLGLEKGMNSWKTDPSEIFNSSATAVNNLDIQVLVDYIDDTPLNNPDIPNHKLKFNCTNILGPNATAVPQDEIDQNAPSGFYGCIDSERTLAKIFIRGNALARSSENPSKYEPGLSSYFPTTTIQVQGRGLLGEPLK